MPEDSQALRVKIRKVVLADTDVKNLISNRFYPASPGIYRQTKYPCANFRVSGGTSDSDTFDQSTLVDAYKRPNMTIWAWSKKSYDEAYKVYRAIKKILHKQCLTEDSRTIVCQEDTRPMEAYEPAENTFYLHAGWSVKMLNYKV